MSSAAAWQKALEEELAAIVAALRPQWESDLEADLAEIVKDLSTGPEPPPWLASMPETVVFVDVETTGFLSDDRVVSLAALKLQTRSLATGRFDLEAVHLLFNPGRKSHPKARRVHGFSDAKLAKQAPFREYAEAVRQHLQSADLLVAHNASFDLLFLNRELTDAGLEPLDVLVHCTMEDFRARGIADSAALDVVCDSMGMSRSGETHGAAEDAWLAMMAYLWLNGCPVRADFPAAQLPLTNLPMPDAR